MPSASGLSRSPKPGKQDLAELFKLLRSRVWHACGAKTTVTSCDQVVFMDQPAEHVATDDPVDSWCCCAVNRLQGEAAAG